jgi:hypothetical protein
VGSRRIVVVVQFGTVKKRNTAMMNHFKINVSKADGLAWNGEPRFVHYFRAEVRDEPEAMEVANELRLRFPVAHGFKVSVTEWRASGRDRAF